MNEQTKSLDDRQIEDLSKVGYQVTYVHCFNCYTARGDVGSLGPFCPNCGWLWSGWSGIGESWQIGGHEFYEWEKVE